MSEAMFDVIIIDVFASRKMEPANLIERMWLIAIVDSLHPLLVASLCSSKEWKEHNLWLVSSRMHSIDNEQVSGTSISFEITWLMSMCRSKHNVPNLKWARWSFAVLVPHKRDQIRRLDLIESNWMKESELELDRRQQWFELLRRNGRKNERD